MSRRRREQPELLARQAGDTDYQCALCERTVKRVTRHHLIPRSEGGRVVVDLCVPCHKTLHSFFSNHTLSSQLSTLEALRQEPDIARYLAWIRKQPDTIIRVHRRSERR